MFRFSYYQQLSQRIGPMTVRHKYDIDRHDVRLRSLHLHTSLLAVFYFSYTLVDIFLLPDVAWRSVLLRTLIVGPPTIMLFAYFKRPVSIRRKELAAVLVVCLATVVWCAVLLGSDDPQVLGYFYAGLVFIMVLTIILLPPFEYSLYGSLFVFACLYATVGFLAGADSSYIVNHLALSLPVLVLTLIANYRFCAESLRLYLENVSVEKLRAELTARNAELETISHADPLTGLANRRVLTRRAAELQKQPAGQHCLAVIIVDVDYFKAFNDYYGHAEGDNCLRAVANAIRGACNANDVVCRFGGEEFLILRSEHNLRPHGALVLAEHIRQQVAKLAIPHHATQEGSVTVSAGVCTGPFDPDAELDRLIKAADIALYEAKREGRNRVRYGSHKTSKALPHLPVYLDNVDNAT